MKLDHSHADEELISVVDGWGIAYASPAVAVLRLTGRAAFIPHGPPVTQASLA